MSRDLGRSSVRVVHVSSAHPAGDPRIFEKMCTSLSRAGYDVRLIATEEAPAGTPFPVVAYQRSGRRLVRMSLGVARAVFRAIRMRPSVVHLHDPELIPSVALFRLFGIKVVFDSHEHIAASMTNKQYLPRAVRGVVRRMTGLLVSFVDRAASGIVTATPAIADDFHNPRRAVIQNSPILDQWTEVADEVRPPGHLVFIGCLSEVRGAFQMLDAIERLGATHGAHLTIAGDISDDLLARLQAHAGWRYTDYVGMLDRSELAELLARSTVGVVLFLPEPNHIYSQPTKMFEYMAAGVPVLASDYPLWRELVVTSGVGVVTNPLDVDSIVSAAASLLDSPVESAKMGRRGRELVETTRNWAVEAEHLIAFYDDLTGVTPAS